VSIQKKLIPRIGLMQMGETLSITRYTKWEYVKGRPQAEKADGIIVKGSVQPLTGSEILKLEEGERTREHYWCWTKGDIKKKDLVTFNSNCFEVQVVEDWLNHKKARMVKIDVDIPAQ